MHDEPSAFQHLSKRPVGRLSALQLVSLRETGLTG
jgi:hypothetical protein